MLLPRAAKSGKRPTKRPTSPTAQKLKSLISFANRTRKKWFGPARERQGLQQPFETTAILRQRQTDVQQESHLVSDPPRGSDCGEHERRALKQPRPSRWEIVERSWRAVETRRRRGPALCAVPFGYALHQFAPASGRVFEHKRVLLFCQPELIGSS